MEGLASTIRSNQRRHIQTRQKERHMSFSSTTTFIIPSFFSSFFCCFLFSSPLLLLLPCLPAQAHASHHTRWVAGGGGRGRTEAVFVFSDSLGDTGNGPFVNHPTATMLPFGITAPGYPAGRFSDGLVLAADFIAEYLSVPPVNPWLNVYEDFRKGANYAIPGATATDIIPFPLQKQVDWHMDLVALSAAAAGARTHDVQVDGDDDPQPRSKLPSMEVIEGGLYVIQIGGLDYRHYYLDNLLSPEWVNMTIVPLVVDQTQIALERLYNESGARKFVVVGIPAQGCLPSTLAILTTLEVNEESGCIDVVNVIAENHRYQALNMLADLRERHSDATYTFIDFYQAHIFIIQHATVFGFENTFDACCGAGPSFPYGYNDTYYHCTNSTSSLYVCDNPTNYINWDGVHFTHAFNFQLFNQTILSHSFMYPSDDDLGLPFYLLHLDTRRK